MKALAANLKTLYQCPGLWLWHFIGLVILAGAVSQPLSDPVAAQGKFMPFLLVSFIAGLVIGSVAKEVRWSPFTFCLPGHRSITRSMVFAVGGVQSVLLSLLVLAYPGLRGPTILAGMASAAFLGMTVFLVTVCGTFGLRNAAAFVGVPILLLRVIEHLFFKVSVMIENAALFHPVANLLVLVVVASWTWNRLGNRDAARREVGSAFLPLQSLWSRPVVERFNRAWRLERLERQSKVLWGRVEAWFLSRMRRVPSLSGRRHVIGSRYVIFGSALASSFSVFVLGVIAVALLAALLGFVALTEKHQELSTANVLYLIPCLLGLTVQIPLYSTLLVPAGRKERFRSCLVISLRTAVGALILSAALCASTVAIGTLMPEISLSGEAFTYLPMDPKLGLLPLLVLPLLLACQVGFPRRATIPQTVILVGITLLTLAMPAAFLQQVHLAALVIPGAFCWWLYVGSLHHYCYYQDLALG